MEIDSDNDPDWDLDGFHSKRAVGMSVIGIEIAIEIGIERANGFCETTRQL